MRKGRGGAETQREQLGLPWAEPRGAHPVGSFPDRAWPPEPSSGPGSGPDLQRDLRHLPPLGLSFLCCKSRDRGLISGFKLKKKKMAVAFFLQTKSYQKPVCGSDTKEAPGLKEVSGCRMLPTL